MRIGVVSDTHNNLKNCRRIARLFNETGVDAVVHTGDITQAKTLAVFAALDAPLYGVYGNNDQERDALDSAARELGFCFRDPPIEFAWSNRRIIVVHDPRDLTGALGPEHDLALHGHTYKKGLSEWTEHVGQHVLVKGDEVVGFFASYEAAITEGYGRFGPDPFLVKQVSIIEQTHFVPAPRIIDAALHGPS
ncbi:MAG: YfcE family phosphodiesterase [Gammaproteobacteria bacterium]|nr:YfcE family phosphodiesterase [Gammaproteobacteria bacterium]